MKITEKIRVSFYFAPNTANVTANSRDKYLINLDKDLQIWVENMHTKMVCVDDNMLRQIALSLYEFFHKKMVQKRKEVLLKQVENGCIG
jgi:hypothetical protein